MQSLFPIELVTRENPCTTLASMWFLFSHLKHITSIVRYGGAFACVSDSQTSYVPSDVATSVTPVATAQLRRPGRPPWHDISNASPTHSHIDLVSVNYRLWSFDGKS